MEDEIGSIFYFIDNFYDCQTFQAIQSNIRRDL